MWGRGEEGWRAWAPVSALSMSYELLAGSKRVMTRAESWRWCFPFFLQQGLTHTLSLSAPLSCTPPTLTLSLVLRVPCAGCSPPARKGRQR